MKKVSESEKKEGWRERDRTGGVLQWMKNSKREVVHIIMQSTALSTGWMCNEEQKLMNEQKS